MNSAIGAATEQWAQGRERNPESWTFDNTKEEDWLTAKEQFEDPEGFDEKASKKVSNISLPSLVLWLLFFKRCHNFSLSKVVTMTTRRHIWDHFTTHIF